MLKTILSFCCAVIAGSYAHDLCAQLPQPAQDIVDRNIPKPVPASPNVAALGKFGDYQVSHFTGLPEISIPIFEAKSGDLSVPIILSYHASGIKPTDVASWVGANWAISAGGQISRSVRGKPDEGDYTSEALKGDPNVCGGPGVSTFYYLQNAARGVRDTDPDIYGYSYPGGRGKFIMPYGGVPYLIPAVPVKLDHQEGDQYTITDERGTVHTFGKNSLGIVATEFTSGTGISAKTAWYLMEMTAPNSDDEVTFTYQDVGTAYINDVAYSYTILDQCFAANGATCPSNTLPTAQISNVFNSVPQKANQTIYFENGKVEFMLSNDQRSDAVGLKSLDRIEIFGKVNGTYELQRTAKFVYSYFTAQGESAGLKLDALQFKDSEGTLVQEYRFTYFTNSLSWNTGHANFLNARDLWGYYNGALQNNDLILPKTVPYQETAASPPGDITIGGALNRDVNVAYIKEGVLSRIDFPTGGYTEFDYESNKYYDGGIKNAGGIRVTKITSRPDASSPAVVKTYRYGSAESGYGIANFNPFQFNYATTQHYYSMCEVSNPILDYQIRTFHSNTAFNQDSFDSSPVRYPQVTEYIGDPSNSRLGKVVYEYTNDGDVDHVVPSSGKYYRNTFFWKRGKLLSKTVYDSMNQKVAETKIVYDVYNTENDRYVGIGVHEFLAGVNACASLTCQNEASEVVGTQTYQFAKYFQSTGTHLESQVQEFLYEPGVPGKYVLTQTDKVYEILKTQLKQVAVNRSNGDQVVTVNTYPFELSANASSTGNAKGIYKLNMKNIVASPVESFTYLVRGGSESIISGQLTTLMECPANANYVVPDKVGIWESDQPLPKSSYVPVEVNATNNGLDMDSHYRERISMVAYDNVGNIQTVAKTNDAGITYLWGYNNARPVAQIVNASLDKVSYSSFESDGKGNWGYTGTPANLLAAKTGEFYYPLSAGNITRQLPAGKYKLEYWAKGTVSLSGGTITAVRTSPADANGWILYEKEVVMATTTTLTVSGGSGAYLDELRMYPSDAQMTTYTYDPLNGITSVTDPSNFTVYYDYDAFGRLKFVKDKDGFIEKMNEYNYKFK